MLVNRSYEAELELHHETERWKNKFKESSNDIKLKVEFFNYLDSLEGDDLSYALRDVVEWYRVNGVICDYLVHALSTGVMSIDYFIGIIDELFRGTTSYEIMYPTVIYLCSIDLLYPKDFEKVIESLATWNKGILTDCADYLFGDLSTEELVNRMIDFTGVYSIYKAGAYIKCCATVSEQKTEDLVRRLLDVFNVEELFQQTYVLNNSYVLGWMLLAERVVIRVGEKRLSDYDEREMTSGATDRIRFLILVLDSQV